MFLYMFGLADIAKTADCARSVLRIESFQSSLDGGEHFVDDLIHFRAIGTERSLPADQFSGEVLEHDG